jgi:hypothetical protein
LSLRRRQGPRNPQLNVFGASLDDVVLTRNPERHRRELEERIREIERLIDRKQMELTVAALNRVEELRKKRLVPSETDRLSEAIEDNLLSCSGLLTEWWWDNVDTHVQASSVDFYDTIRDAILGLGVEHLRTLPEGVRARIGSICQQILAGKAADQITTLITKIRLNDGNANFGVRLTGGIRPNPIGSIRKPLL